MVLKDEVFKWVVEILVREFDLNPEDLKATTHLVDDLDLDSIDAIDLTVRIEEKTSLSFSEEDLMSILTIQDAVDMIHERL